MRAGFELFSAAVLSVLHHPIAALKIAWLPYLLGLSAFLAMERSGDPEGLVPLVLGVVIDATMVAVVAVGWHRFRLLGDAPGLLGGHVLPRRFMRYAIEWFVLGLAIGLALIVVLLPLIMGLAFLSPDDLGTLTAATYSGYYSLTGTVVLFLVVWAFTWLFFRLALSLPYLAIEDGALSRLPSWRMSRGQEPAVIVCAGCAALGYIVFQAPSIWAFELFSDGALYVDPNPAADEVYRYKLWFLAMTQLGWTLVTLFGAAILTELYRRAGPSGANVANKRAT